MARQSAASSTSDKALSRRILVLVSRDPMLKTPRGCWEHEFPILEAVFGEGNVTPIDAKTLDEGYTSTMRPDMLAHNKTQDTITRPSDSQGLGFVFIGDPGVEYERLGLVYGRLPDENRLFVESIYGRAAEKRFAALVGKPELDDLPDAQLRALVLDYGYAPIPHKDAGQDEKNEVFRLRKELSTMPKDGLVKLAEELGVQVG